MIALLLDLSVKATLLCLAAAVVTALMRRASAASRHAVWTGMFVAVLALPIARVLLPGLPVFVLAPQVERVSMTVPPLAIQTVGANVVADSTPAAAAPVSSFVSLSHPRASAVVAEPLQPTVPSPGDVVVPLWLCGVFLLLLRAAVGSARVRRLNRSASTVTEAGVLNRVQTLRRLFGVRRPIVLRAYPAWMPMTWGVLRPVILAPAAALDTGANGRALLEPLLVHEVAHIARFDVVSAALARFAVACGWFNPFLWLAARQARLERERACDDAVLTRGADLKASEYANQLLVLAQTAHPALTGGSNVLAMARRSQLESRVRSILDARTNRRATSRASRVVAATLVIIAVPVAAVRLAARTVPETVTSRSVEAMASSAPVPQVDTAVVRAIARGRQPVAVAPAIHTLAAQTPVTQVAAPAPVQDAPRASQLPPNYVIGVSDLLTITVSGAPELSGDFRVRSDGNIALPRGNPVPAVGWTVDGFKDALTAELKRCCLATPEVFVQVKQIVSRGTHTAFFFFNQDTAADAAPRRLPLATAFAQQPDWNLLWSVLSARELEAEKHVALRVQIGQSTPLDPAELKRARQALDSLVPWSGQPSDVQLFSLRSRFGDALRNLDVVEVRFDNGLVSVKALADAYVAAAESLKEAGNVPFRIAAHEALKRPSDLQFVSANTPQTEYRLVASSGLSDAELTNALKNAAIMSPDIGRADMLLGLAQRYAFTPEMVALYVSAANGIKSEAERARVFAQAIKVK